MGGAREEDLAGFEGEGEVEVDAALDREGKDGGVGITVGVALAGVLDGETTAGWAYWEIEVGDVGDDEGNSVGVENGVEGHGTEELMMIE